MQRKTSKTHSGRWLWAAASGIAVLYVGSTLLTPLYPLYERRFGFAELGVTEIYAIYVVGNLAVLFLFGRLSDQIGRRPVALIALAITIVSALCFLFARGEAWLFPARILNGFAAGLGAGTITAWIAEIEPHGDRARAAAFASAGNLAGLALGALGAGLLARFAPWPLRLSFVCFIAVLAAVIVMLVRAPETIETPIRSPRGLSLTPRIGVPRGIRVQFIAPAAMAFIAFALGGFYAALAPGLLIRQIGESDVAVIGGIVALFFVSASVTVVATRALANRTALYAASVLVWAGLALLLAADALRSMALIVAASLVGGMAMALAYRSSLGIVNAIAPADRRAELVSSYLLVCYSANALPVIGVGLITGAIGATNAHRVLAAALAALALVACVLGARKLPPE
jgi:MFS family permease